jgi:predicted MFS family arabinose efflux permease
MTGAFLTMMIGLFFLSYWPTRVGFAAGSILFLGLATCVMTFTLSLVARLDVTGKAAALPAAALGIGSIVGPAMAGHVYQAIGVHGMIASCALSLLVATAAYRSAYPTP